MTNFVSKLTISNYNFNSIRLYINIRNPGEALLLCHRQQQISPGQALEESFIIDLDLPRHDDLRGCGDFGN
jgi:hypothetical protein